MRSSIRIFLLTLTLSWCLVDLVNAQVMTLDSILSTIERQNPMLKQYESRTQAINEYAKGSKSWMPPMVGAGTFMTPYPNQTLMDERDKGSLMFSIEQEIPNPAKLNANKNYFTSKAAVENESRAVQFNQLRSEAKELYYQWIIAEKKLILLKESERLIELMLKLARIRYPYNQGNLGNIYKAEGRLSEVQNMIEMTNGDIDERAYRLKSLMNVPFDMPLAIDTTMLIMYTPDPQVYDTAALSLKRSDIRQIEKTIDVMRLNQQVQRYQAKPEFKIRFDHMQPIGDMPKQFTAMAMVSIPIAPWSSKMYRGEVRGMQYDIEAMKNEREAILLETKGMLAGMASQLDRMKRQLENYRMKIIPALRKNYQTLMLSYEENREQLPAVIDAWEALNMAQLEYLDKNEEYVNMIVRYEKELEK